MKTFLTPGCRTLAALMSVAIAGCMAQAELDPLPRVAVSGKVTINGQPMPAGTIQFNPTSSTASVTAVGEIVDGKYTIDRTQGPVPGHFRIQISAQSHVTVAPNEEPGGGPRRIKESIPARYNVKSELECDVKAEGPNEFDFDLKSK